MNRSKLNKYIFLFFLFFVCISSSAQADERVLEYTVVANLHEDGSMVVTERIRVIIEQILIRHGITHAFPIKKRYDGTKLQHYGFELLNVSLDGQPVPFSSSTVGPITGLAIGQHDVGAPLGEHIYEIVYRTTGHVRFLPDRDELYYNVMASNWPFPVDHVSFTLVLPGENQNAFLETAAYTGRKDQGGQDYGILGKHTVLTTRVLESGEGLTVAMAWEKGLIQEPGQNMANFLGAHRTEVLLLILLLTSSCFFGIHVFLNSLPKETVVPLFSAPPGMSPGSVAALKNMAYTASVLHADIIWSAISGFLRVDVSDTKKVLLQKKDPVSTPRHEHFFWAHEHMRGLRDHLFAEGQSQIDLHSNQGQTAAAGAFTYLREQYKKQQEKFWSRSYLPVIPGVFLMFGFYYWALQYIYTPMFDPGSDFENPAEFLAILTGVLGLIGLFLAGIRKVFILFKGWHVWALVSLIALFLAGATYVLVAVLCPDVFFVVIFAASLGITGWYVFFPPGRILKKGRSAYAHMQGLEMYIRTAEKDRLAQLNAPEDTLEKFEELLPYAIALGCAKAWEKRFRNVLATLPAAPDWISTSGIDDLAYSQAIASVMSVSGLQAAAMACVQAAQTRESSHSGSDGGSSENSGFDGGSVGGGSGGSSVGGW